jgi:hypothetical protein
LDISGWQDELVVREEVGTERQTTPVVQQHKSKDMLVCLCNWDWLSRLTWLGNIDSKLELKIKVL